MHKCTIYAYTPHTYNIQTYNALSCSGLLLRLFSARSRRARDFRCIDGSDNFPFSHGREHMRHAYRILFVYQLCVRQCSMARICFYVCNALPWASSSYDWHYGRKPTAVMLQKRVTRRERLDIHAIHSGLELFDRLYHLEFHRDNALDTAW